ncbi:MAG: hypothetical protein ACK4M4_05520 [Flavobacterium sp.]
MKQHLILLVLVLSLSGFNKTEKLSLKNFVEEKIQQSIIGLDPIIVTSPYSAKIYSKLDLKHPVWNNLKREELIIIPKNADMVEKLWGQQAKINGVILYKAAQEKAYDSKKLKYVLNGKEISKAQADTVDMKNITNFIVVKDPNSDGFVTFLNSLK